MPQELLYLNEENDKKKAKKNKYTLRAEARRNWDSNQLQYNQ